MAVLLLIGLVPAVTAAEKKRDWQMGKVLDAQVVKTYAGSSSHSTPLPGLKADGKYSTEASTVTNTTADYDTNLIVTIQGDTRVYIASERITLRNRHAANLTVNAPVKYAVEKNKLFLLGEDGKEHEAHITKQILRTDSDGSSQQPMEK